VNLTFAVSSLLTDLRPSAVAARTASPFLEGSGRCAVVFTTPSNEQAHTCSTQLPIQEEMGVHQLDQSAGGHASGRTSAAYPMAKDPFADPPVS